MVRPFSSRSTAEIVSAPKVYAWSAGGFDLRNLAAFRRRYPGGENFVVAADLARSQTRRYGELAVRLVRADGLSALA